MTTHDLGTITEPVLLCGGAYSNLEAFEAMLAAAKARGIEPSQIIHNGDVVAYCADPLATPAALRASGAHAIKGNVEIQLAEGAAECGCGFAEGTACAAMSGAWYGHAARSLAGESELLAWMGQLPDRITFTISGRRFHVLHGAASAVNRYIFASSDETVFEHEFALAGVDIEVIIGGHSGLPFTRKVGGRIWHNTGALGLPANDGTPVVWYSLLTPEPDGVRFEHLALGYDHAGAAAKMRRAGLPAGYADALETGLWPSLDTLAPAERRRTGIAIAPDSAFFHSGEPASGSNAAMATYPPIAR